MNKFILCAMNRENRTVEELKDNAAAAAYAAAADAVAAAVAADAVATAAAAAAAAYAAVAAYADELWVNYWLNRYFELTGDNREDYEKAIKEKE